MGGGVFWRGVFGPAMGGKSRSTNDWRRMLFSANRDWNPDYRQLSRDDFVEHRMEQRQMLVRFVTQGSHSLPVCSRPEAQAVVDFALASREDVLALSTVCREWSLACRVWLWSELSEPLWRRVCESLCPRTGRTHPELASKSMLLGWLRLPMAVGTLAGWLSQERYDNICLSRDGLCSTRFELAHSLATLFGFMANAGEASRFHRWRAPRYVGWSRLQGHTRALQLHFNLSVWRSNVSDRASMLRDLQER